MALLTPRRPRRRTAATVLALVLGWLSTPAARAASLEYAVKANYLYKFAPFVDWPPRAFDGQSSPLVVCVAGDDPFGDTLDSAVRGQTVAGHPVVVRRMAAVAANPACHVLYLGHLHGQSVTEALALTRGAPVLTVTDPAQGSAGGAIQFVLKDGRVRFALDVARAQAGGLALSSKLQALAVSLKGAS